MDKHDASICILDSSNLYMEDTIYDDIDSNAHVSEEEYENINMDYEFPNILSTQLTLTFIGKYSDSH